jgi:hypothetical protein
MVSSEGVSFDADDADRHVRVGCDGAICGEGIVGIVVKEVANRDGLN